MKKSAIEKNALTIGIIVAVLVSIALILPSPAKMGITGYSVKVSYYGVSNYPISSQAGSIQTKVTIKQPTLANMKSAATAMQVASDIVQTADFANGVVSAYQGDPPAPIPTGALDVVITAAGYVTDYFKKETKCMRYIGNNYGQLSELTFALVSKIAYSQCSHYPDWNYAYIQHNYYTMDGKRFCRQESSKLFSVKQVTGETSSSTYGC